MSSGIGALKGTGFRVLRTLKQKKPYEAQTHALRLPEAPPSDGRGRAFWAGASGLWGFVVFGFSEIPVYFENVRVDLTFGIFQTV